MATLGMAATHASILPSGIDTWKVKWGIDSTADDAYYSLGSLAAGSIGINSLQVSEDESEDGAPHVFGFELVASANMLCTHKTTVLELLHNLGNAQLAHKITALNGKTFAGNFGTKWTFDSTQDYSGYRFIKIEANHRFLTDHDSLEDLGAILATPAADGTPDVGDTLYTWSAVGKYPAGVSAFQINPGGDNETIGKFRNARLVCELLTEPDNLGRMCGTNIRITAEADMMQAATELAIVGPLTPNVDTCVVTLADGAVFTLTDKVGMKFAYTLAGGPTKQSFIHLTCTGVIKSTDWAGIVS